MWKHWTIFVWTNPAFSKLFKSIFIKIVYIIWHCTSFRDIDVLSGDFILPISLRCLIKRKVKNKAKVIFELIWFLLLKDYVTKWRCLSLPNSLLYLNEYINFFYFKFFFYFLINVILGVFKFSKNMKYHAEDSWKP